jgi:hypothetical protein
MLRRNVSPMKMKRYLLIALVASFALSSAWAKRTAAPKVDPVTHEGVKYLTPNDNGRKGYVQAWDVKTNKKLWEKKVFKNWIKPFLEEDVQWVFIKSMILKDGKLIITDERNKRYSLDPKTQKVIKLKEEKKPEKSS